MATLTTNLPSRLRQLLSRETAIGPSLKLDAEPPGKIKDFIGRVLKCPLQEIAVPLSEFKWEHNKGNFYHWRPLLLHFDLYFKTYVSNRNDLMLVDDILEDATPFPKQDVMQILRVLKTIFENCHNKTSYDGLEHLKLLLASTDPEIITAALETLSALVRINPSKLHSSGKLIPCGSINGCLLSLAQGWGSKEEGLGLHSCVTTMDKIPYRGPPLPPSEPHSNADKSQSRFGSTLYFEIHGDGSQKASATGGSSGGYSSTVIHLTDLNLRKEDDLTLMKQCMDGRGVPQEHRFSLLTRIRYARAFCSPVLGRSYSRICLLAFIVLVQSNDAHDELVSFFANEPEYSNELIRIVRSEDTVNGAIRALAMLALGAQLAAYSSSHERARILSGSSINFAGGNRMILLNVLQRAVLNLNSSSDPSSISFVEAILQFYLLHVISSSSSASVVRGSGMVPTFLPLLEDSNSSHMHLVCCAVKTLQKLMDYSNTSVTLFKDLGGVDLLAQRLQVQVNTVISSTQMAVGEDDQMHTQKRLIKVLLKALGSATYSPANSTRIQNPHDTSMPTTLSLIFTNVEKFGGDIYFSAVTVMSEIIHKDPTCFSVLHEAGLPESFLSSIVAGVIPSSKALTCIPNGLGAICLNTKGLESVKEMAVLTFLVDIFTSKKYVSALNDGIVPLANAFEELLRHASSLRGDGVDIIIKIIEKITSFGGDDGTGTGCETTVMETDSVEKEKGDSDSRNISEEQFTQLCVFHVMVLVHRTMENSETCRLFVEKSGIEALLKLLLRPHVAHSSEGMSIALHSTMVFKGFTQHHSAPLAHAFCSALRGQLNNALSCFQTDSRLFLLDPARTPNVTLFSALFLVEFLLFLAASKDNRWVTSLLAEFGNGSKDVLESIGHVHREVLWQIAILDDSKLQKEGGDAGSSVRPHRSEASPGETSDQRFDSFRQLIDPLLRTRMSGWNVESQFFDLLNLYRDIGRSTTGFPRRAGIDGSSRLRSAHTTDHVPNPGPDSTAAADEAAMETEKQRSYHSSCCEMVKSLSFHIIHLFQELGKVMLAPSRRREDTANISPASKSVASTFALLASAHMNYGGHKISPGCEIPVSTKCRYLGKVIDFIDGILLDRPDSCNPILLNCLYGHGVVHLVLTTFEATSQLLFAINRGLPSPMDTDDGHSKQGISERADSSWIDGPLACYAKFLDHLVTSSFILSPSSKNYLTQSLGDGDIPFPRDGEAFVKVLQSMVLKAVLPVWTHPHFTDCDYDFISIVISIIRHVHSGVEVKTVNNSAGSIASAQPPNETSISTIVEMGFTRSRAEEALRQVGANCVEFAMEWLFSHPAESQEDDELARALAISLGGAGSEPKAETPGENVKQNPPPPNEDIILLPPVNELLSTCVKLLQMKEKLAFPVRDLLVMICSQHSGQDRSGVISFIVDQVKHCGFTTDIGKDVMLSTLLHVLALILHEDVEARRVAYRYGFVKIASDLLFQWDSASWSEANPRWVAAAFLAIDRMLQVDQSLNPEIVQQLKEEEDGGTEKSEKLPSPTPGPASMNLDIHEQKRLVNIACHCLGRQLPSETVHSVLQLCSTLTINHTVALSFLHEGGLPLLLSLPLGSLFPGFDNVAATIIRHIIEDPQTLQQAMESEIRHSLMSAVNRHPNGRMTPRNFISVLGSVISRDPVIFMQAARAVTEVEMVGDRSYIVLLKDSEKDKKEKSKTATKDNKLQITEGKPSSANTPPPAVGKLPDLNTKGAKVHRKSPQSFTSVIELLLDYLITSVPNAPEEVTPNVRPEGPSLTDMDIDLTVIRGKGKAVVTSSENNDENNQETSASVAKTAFVLKLLTEILLMYGSSVHVLIRRDAEVAASRTHRGHVLPCSGGIFSHTLHKFIPHPRNQRKEKKMDGDWKNKLSSRASQFLVAACVRSTEARRRVLFDISNIFEDFAGSSVGLRAPGNDVYAHIELVNEILAARSPSGASISAEASAAIIDVGLVKSLTRTLQVLDLDHSDTTKFVTRLIKALESVTREHVHYVDSNAGKQENTPKYDQSRQAGGYIDGDVPQPMETLSHLTHSSVPAALRSFSNTHTHESSEGVTDDMEHDQDYEGGFGHDTEDDYMREGSEEGRGIENGMNTVGIRFEIQQHVQEGLGDEEDDEMSGDDVEEDDDDDDEEHNGLEEDEVHHMPHRDTDPDDHEIEDDDFVEEMLGEEEEEDEEEEDDDEDGVILRLDEGVNGIDVLDHIEVFGRENSLPNETLHVMPVEVFGSRRQGRTTSIYSLLGRTGDSAEPSQHPLLVEPSSQQPTSSRPIDNGRDTTRSIEIPGSRLETIFHSLSDARHGHRFSLWMDGNQQGSSSTAPVVPQGLEELLVSQLRRPVPDKPSEPNTQAEDPQNKEKSVQLDNLNIPEVPSEDTTTNGNRPVLSPSTAAVDGTGNSDPRPENGGNDSAQAPETLNMHSQYVEMQFEQADGMVRDVEAVSQESSGSGATLGESLRSLDVEIGSTDGHEEGGERQVSAGDVTIVRPRRTNVLFGASPLGGRDLPLHSVVEVSENPNGEADHGVSTEEQQNDGRGDSGRIDPAFLDALPEDMRAEVLSAQQGQTAQPPTAEPQNAEDIDPEFLAALPPDIRAEVLAQQHAQRVHQSQELEGQPVEMDTVSIIATFPSELREEVLLTSSDAILANLTPALVAEANMLRERFAHRYYNHTLFGTHRRTRRGEGSRRGDGIRSNLQRVGGSGASRKLIAGKPVEASGNPLVDCEALSAMIRLLRVVQPLYKGQLQRLLLHLSAHGETRISLVKILMEMLMLDTRKQGIKSNIGESSFRLYACQSNVTYSRPQFSDGVPPLVSRRILETMTFLARNHPSVAKSLLHYKFNQKTVQEPESVDDRGKGAMICEDEMKEQCEGCAAIALLLSLLNQPLYLRSIAHLEQLLNLMEVVIDNADVKSVPPITVTEPPITDQPSGSEAVPSETPASASDPGESGPSNDGATPTQADGSSKPLISVVEGDNDSLTVLQNLPRADLRLLCSFLAREGLSDNAYSLVAEVLKKLVAISPSHSELFVTELAKSVHSLSQSAAQELHLFREADRALLITSSSIDGAAVLRVLQSLSSLIRSITDRDNDHTLLSAVPSQIHEINVSLEPLWHELSSCISRIESYSEVAIASISKPSGSSSSSSSVMPPLPAGTQNILPYIESFFVTCEKLQPGPGPGEDEARASPSGHHRPGEGVGFVRFSEKHRKLLNAFIRQNTGLLDKSFSMMLKMPRLVDFDNKRAHFRSKIKQQHEHNHHNPLRISVRRNYVLEDSYNQLRMRSAQDLKARLTVHFQGEEGIDAGGLTREWYLLLSRVIFDKNALLFTTVGNHSTFQPNPNSVYQTEHLSYFKFVGRVVAKALFDSQLLDVHFTRSFYKHILGVKVTYHDIEAIDPDYFKNLKWMLENDISDILDLTFSIDADEEKLILYERTEVTDYELIPGGRNVRVTEENKHKYVDLMVEHKLTTAIRPQINSFLEGFNELIPRALISIFNDKELELLITGLPDIDLEDLRANTEYSGYGASSQMVQWFWEVVQGISKEDRARLLQFVTGTSKVPLEGFSALQGISGSQKFQIHKAYGHPDHLPSAHTCFNQLDLPEYPSKEHLEDRLLLAIHEGSEGFGFG